MKFTKNIWNAGCKFLLLIVAIALNGCGDDTTSRLSEAEASLVDLLYEIDSLYGRDSIDAIVEEKYVNDIAIMSDRYKRLGGYNAKYHKVSEIYITAIRELLDSESLYRERVKEARKGCLGTSSAVYESCVELQASAARLFLEAALIGGRNEFQLANRILGHGSASLNEEEISALVANHEAEMKAKKAEKRAARKKEEQAENTARERKEKLELEATQKEASRHWAKHELISRGEQVYASNCSPCHQPNGQGLPPVFPALAGSSTVIGDPAQHIATVLDGRPGTSMAAYRDTLNDADLAAVITFERNKWGNNAGVVQPKMIWQARESLLPSVSAKKMQPQPVTTITEEPTGGPSTSNQSAPIPVAAEDRGRSVYEGACFVCHATGAAGSPKLGDKAAWAPRIQQGMKTLVNNAINGKSAMPPKGGRLDLSDGDIEAAVAFFVKNSR